MALSTPDRKMVERLVGPIEDADEADVEERVSRLGSIRLAALELLQAARVEMDRSASKLAGGRNSSDHTANLERMDRRIAELVAAILSDADSVLSAAAEDLLDEVRGLTLGATSSIKVEARASRRG